MNISKIPENSFTGQILRKFLNIIIPQKAIIPILQGRLRGQKWIVESGEHGCWLGSYENEKRIAFEKVVNSGHIVFDVGANVGYYSLLASILVGPKGMVYSFEPVPKNIYFLKRHIQLNNIRNIVLIEAAVSDRNGSSTFISDKNTKRSRCIGKLSPNGNIIVKTVSLDRLFEQGDIPIPKYIKIDVEGAEMLVFLGARKILSKFHPTIFLATHGDLIHQECCDFLESMGYEIDSIDGKDVRKSQEIIASSQYT